MIIFDAHCDTIPKIIKKNESIYENSCHIDLIRLKNKKPFVQMFAAFIDPLYGNAYGMKRALQIIDKLYQQVDIYKNDIMLCVNYNDIEKAINESKIAALLSIEGGEALAGDLGVLRMFYKLGVRSICLTWNFRNEIADGVNEDVTTMGGLTLFGRDVIKEMNSLGMIIDVSHISETGFWDVIDISTKPIIASHSNAKKICSNKRNLNDNQIVELNKKGGVMGINLLPHFLNDNCKATILDIIKHIEHVAGIASLDCIGLGADFDGVDCLPDDIDGVQDIDKIFNELLKLNYSEESVNKIAGNNFLNLFKKLL